MKMKGGQRRLNEVCPCLSKPLLPQCYVTAAGFVRSTMNAPRFVYKSLHSKYLFTWERKVPLRHLSIWFFQKKRSAALLFHSQLKQETQNTLCCLCLHYSYLDRRRTGHTSAALCPFWNLMKQCKNQSSEALIHISVLKRTHLMLVRGTPSCCVLHCNCNKIKIKLVLPHGVFCRVQTNPETINTEENYIIVIHYKFTVKTNPFKETSLRMWDSRFHSAKNFSSSLLIKAATVLLYHSITCWIFYMVYFEEFPQLSQSSVLS